MAIDRLPLCWLYPSRIARDRWWWWCIWDGGSYHPTRPESDRNDYRHHASRAWSVCACCCCIFFNRFLSDRLSGVCGVGLNAQQAANQKPETADGSHFLPTAFLKLVNLKEITRKIKLKKKNHLHFHWFSPTWLTFSPRETRYDYQLFFLKTQRQSQFRMRYGTHLFSWVRFKVHKFVNSSICKPH